MTKSDNFAVEKTLEVYNRTESMLGIENADNNAQVIQWKGLAGSQAGDLAA